MKYIKMFENFTKKIVYLEEFKFLLNSDENFDIDNYLIILPNNKTVSFDEYIDNGYNVQYPITNDHVKSPIHKKNQVPSGLGSKKGKMKDWGE